MRAPISQILFLILVLFYCSNANAQFNLGVSVGVNYAKTNLSGSLIEQSPGTRITSTVSLLSRLDVTTASAIQMELSWIGRGFESPILSDLTFDMRYLDLGLLYLLDVNQGPVRVQLGFGPTVAYALKGTLFSPTANIVEVEFGPEGLKRYDFILNGIIATEFDLGNFKGIIDLRWQRSMIDISNENDLSFLLNEGERITYRGLSLSFGVLVPLTR